MTLVSSVWREVTQKLGLLKALIGFCTIAGEESKRKAEPRTRSASRLSLAEMKRFELLRRGTPDLPHFECGPFNHLGTSPRFNFLKEKIQQSPLFSTAALIKTEV